MIKSVFIAFLLCLGSTAFSQTCSIRGVTTDPSSDGKIVRLLLIESDNQVADSAVVVNGRFRLKATVKKPCWACVDINEEEIAYIILEEGFLSLEMNAEGFFSKGTPLNDTFQMGWQMYQQSEMELLENRSKINAMDIDKEEKKNLFLKSVAEGNEITRVLVKKITEQNLTNIVPVFWLATFGQLFTKEEMDAMLSKASPALKNNELLKSLNFDL